MLRIDVISNIEQSTLELIFMKSQISRCVAFVAVAIACTTSAVAGPLKARADAGEPIRIGFAASAPYAFVGGEGNEANSEMGKAIRAATKKHYYPQRRDWEEMILWRAHQVHRQALAKLAGHSYE